MTTVHIRRVPLAEIRRAAVYVNDRRLPLSQIVAEEKPDLAITGVFYNGRWEPVCPLKADGRVLYADAQYNYWALAWDEGPDMAPEVIAPGGVSARANYAGNCVLATGGEAHPTLYYNSDVGGRRGRAAVGITGDGELLLFASADGSKSAMTPEELRDYLAGQQGCAFAVMMDGGRKVNCYDRDADVLIQGRDPSQNLILVWLADSGTDGRLESKGEKPMFKLALGAGHGFNAPGKRCLKALDPNETREWQLNDRVCDYVEARLLAYTGYELLRLDDSDDGADDVAVAARAAQANQWGAEVYLSVHHNAGINGGTGGGIEAYIHPGASPASKVWRDTLYDALIAHTGLKGNRAEPKRTADFEILRKTAMPAVLVELGFMDSATDVPVILSDEFAQQCADAIVEVVAAVGGLVKREGDGPGAWAASAWDKTAEKGILDGTRPEDPVTRQELAVVLDRCGLLD